MLEDYGWDDGWAALCAEVSRPDDVPGRVLQDDGIAAIVVTADGSAPVPLRAKVAVGDWVLVSGGVVREVLHRRSLLRRTDNTGNEQWLAANVNVVLIVCGLDRPFRTGRVDRAIALAWDAGATPVVVLTKGDLDVATPAVPGAVEVVRTSARSGQGLDDVRALARNRTVVLLGESGAGKSTLLNALAGEDVALTGAVREGDAKGRHTTTARHLHLLPGGGWVIDTPGIRSVGLAADVESVDAGFPEIMELGDGCRFGDCQHGAEPGCTVLAALATGALDQGRFDSWRSLRREAEAAEHRADPVQRRRDGKRFGRMAREAHRQKRPGPTSLDD